MKNLFFLTLILIAFSSCGKEEAPESFNISYYPSKTFNASHKLINDYQYNSDHQLITLNTYDTLGNKIAYTKYLYENNRCKCIKSYSKSVLSGMTTYEYSQTGNFLRAINYKLDSTTISGYSTYEYDLNNNVSKVVTYLNNSIIFVTRYSYQNGDMLQSKYYDPIDSLKAVVYYTYDDKPYVFAKFPTVIPRLHNPISISSPNAVDGIMVITLGNVLLNLGRTSATKCTYNNNGLVITKLVTYDNQLSKPEFYSYEYIQQ